MLTKQLREMERQASVLEQHSLNIKKQSKMTNSQLKSVCIDALMHQHNIITKPKMIKIMKDLNGIDYLILQRAENGYLRTYVFIIDKADWYCDQYGRYQQPITLKLCSEPIKK